MGKSKVFLFAGLPLLFIVLTSCSSTPQTAERGLASVSETPADRSAPEYQRNVKWR